MAANSRKKENNDKYYLENREAILASNKKWRDNNPEKTKHLDLVKNLRKFGLTVDSYNDLLFSQDGLCAICKNPESVGARNGGVRNLAVDHCHETGEVRGLLCHHCNVGLGHFKDNIKLLENSIKYLERG